MCGGFILNFDPKDFESIDLQISGENQTSKMDIPLTVEREVPSWMTKQEIEAMPEERSILLSDFDEEFIYLEMPSSACSKGHILNLRIIVANVEDNPEYKFICTVKETSKLPEDRQEVKAKLAAGQEKEWQLFSEIFSARQNEIDDFFQAAKG